MFVRRVVRFNRRARDASARARSGVPSTGPYGGRLTQPLHDRTRAGALPPSTSASLLEEMIERDASDLHITAGERPKLRIDGDITNSNIEVVLTPKDTLQLAYSVLTENQKKRFETEDELDFSFGIQNLARFRGNCFKQRGCVSMVIRQIPFTVKTFEELGLPESSPKMAERPRGLVLVTGPTGSGKSTTLAAMIDKINKRAQGPHHHGRRPDRVHPPPPGLHRQPARGRHRHQELRRPRSSTRCVRTPTSILVGEMRDLETIQAALTIAETGHLAFATLHTNSRGRGDQPHHRRLPEPPAVAGARAARVRARGHHHADAAAEGRAARAARWRRRSWS